MCLSDVKQMFLTEVEMTNSSCTMVLVTANFHCWLGETSDTHQLLLFNKQEHHQEGITHRGSLPQKKQKLQWPNKTATSSLGKTKFPAKISAQISFNYRVSTTYHVYSKYATDIILWKSNHSATLEQDGVVPFFHS